MRLYRFGVAMATFLTLSLVGCGSGSPQSANVPDGTPTIPIATAASTVDDGLIVSTQKVVLAAQGGTLTLPDGATVTIPPGALPRDGMIRFSGVRRDRTQDPDHYYQIEPSMQLLAPARLTLPYAPSTGPVAEADEPELSVFESSEYDPLIDVGGEVTQWADAQVLDRDRAHDTVTLQTTHFTGFGVIWRVHDAAYLAVDVPDDMLRTGDLPVKLTQRAWNPGHVALFLGKSYFNGDGSVIVESGPGPVQSGGGVQKGRLTGWRVSTLKNHGDIYLGARRPRFPLTDDERQQVATRTLSFIGRPYNLVGSSTQFLANLIATLASSPWLAYALPPDWTPAPGVFDPNGLSCVGLVDAAYMESIGRSPVRAIDRYVLAATPVDVYHSTDPVTDVVTRTGTSLLIPVYGVVVQPDTPIDAHGFLPYGRVPTADGTVEGGLYTNQRTTTVGPTTSSYTIVASGVPAGATFTQREDGQGYLLEWTPTSPQRVHIVFTMTPLSQATQNGKPYLLTEGRKPITQALDIEVR